MVESTALEMRHRGNSIGGSNPSLSAKVYKADIIKMSLIVACQQVLYNLPLGFVPIYFSIGFQDFSKLFIVFANKFSFLQFLYFFDFLSHKSSSDNKRTHSKIK